MTNASTVCPDSVLPLLSTMVPEMSTGTSSYSSSKRVWMAKRAALQLAVSKMVSTRRTSTPPSRRPRTCSAYASTSSSKAKTQFLPII